MGNSQTTVSNVRTREAESRLESRKFLRILGGLFFAVPGESWNTCLNDPAQCTPIGNPIAQTYQLHLKDGTAIVRIIDPDDLFSAASAQQCECPPPLDWHSKVILQVVHFTATEEEEANNHSTNVPVHHDDLAKDLDLVDEEDPCVSVGSTPATSPVDHRPPPPQPVVEDDDEDDSGRGSWMTRLFPQIFKGNRASLVSAPDDDSGESPLLRHPAAAPPDSSRRYTHYNSASSGEGGEEDDDGDEDGEPQPPPEEEEEEEDDDDLRARDDSVSNRCNGYRERVRETDLAPKWTGEKRGRSPSDGVRTEESVRLTEEASESEEEDEEERLVVETVAPGSWGGSQRTQSQQSQRSQPPIRPPVRHHKSRAVAPVQQPVAPVMMEESPVVRPIMPANKGPSSNSSSCNIPLSERTTRSGMSSSPPVQGAASVMPRPDTILLRVPPSRVAQPEPTVAVEPVLMPPPKHEWLNHLDRFVPAEEEPASSSNATDSEASSPSSSSASPSPPPSKQKRRRMNQWSKFDLGSEGEEGGDSEAEAATENLVRKQKKAAPLATKSPCVVTAARAVNSSTARTATKRCPTSAARKVVPSSTRRKAATPISTTPCTTGGRRRRRGAAN